MVVPNIEAAGGKVVRVQPTSDNLAVRVELFYPDDKDTADLAFVDLNADQCVELATAVIGGAWQIVQAQAPALFELIKALRLPGVPDA